MIKLFTPKKSANWSVEEKYPHLGDFAQHAPNSSLDILVTYIHFTITEDGICALHFKNYVPNISFISIPYLPTSALYTP